MNAKKRKGSSGCQMWGKVPYRHHVMDTGVKCRKNFSRGEIVRPVFNRQRMRKGA